MLLRGEKLSLDWEKLNDDVKAGRYSDAEAVPLFRALDPLDASATLLEAKLALQAGDATGAEEFLWKALTLQPLRPATYFLLAKVMEETSGPGRTVLKLRWLGLRVLAVSEEIGPADRALLEREYPEWSRGRGPLRRIAEEAGVLLERLGPKVESESLSEPLDVLVDFLELTRGEGDASVLERLQRDPLPFAPVMLGAARDALREPGRTTETTTILLVAALGVVGDVTLIPELVAIAGEREADYGAHVMWAVIQMLRRFPEEGVEILGKSGVGQPAAWRTVVGDVLATLPNRPPVTDALVALSEGLETIADEVDAGYLMVLLERELRRRVGAEEATRIPKLAARVLRGEAIEHLQIYAEMADTFETEIEARGLTAVTFEEIVLEQILFDDGDEPDGFDELEELMEMPNLEPTRREAPKIGRNDACWCGSGKKYKKCHLDQDEGRQPAATPKAAESVAGMSQRLFGQLSDFSMTVIAREEMSAVAKRFFEKPLAAVEDEELEESGFLQWLMYDYPVAKNGRTILAEYLRRYKNVLSEREYGLLEARQGAAQGVYEVTAVEPGKGIHLREVYSKQEVYVVEKSASRQLVKGDYTYQRVELFEGKYALSGHGILIPKGAYEPLLAWVEKERAKGGETAAAFLAGHFPEMLRFILRTSMAGVRHADREGNSLLFSKARYRVKDAAGLRAGLATGAVGGRVWEDRGEGKFDWLEVEDRSGARSVFGQLRLTGEEAEVECLSRERLSAARADLEARVGGAIEHLEDGFKTVGQASQEVSADRPGDAIPADVQRDIINQFKEQHYRKWPDLPLPALGGKTPRQAVKTPKGVNLLEGLLRELDRLEERERRKGNGAYDINLLRKELGLKPAK